MKPKAYLLLAWDCLNNEMLRIPVKGVKEARTVTQALYDKGQPSHFFGQAVHEDDQRTDIFPKQKETK